MSDLQGTIAVVTGASRGAGRGIALALGAAGATVYVTGRSVQGRATNNWPGTVELRAHHIAVAPGSMHTDIDGTQPLPFELPDSGSSAAHN